MKTLSKIILLLICFQALLILFSWIGDAYGMSVHSLLSASGTRWAFGKLTAAIATPYLVWLLIIGATYGIMVGAGYNFHPTTYRHRLAWRTVFALFILFVASIILLAFVPHAVLLNVAGSLYPSPFLSSIVPFCALFLIVASMLYGSIVGRYHNFSAVISALCKGISLFAPIIVLYLIVAIFVQSLIYVF
ncbi:MAG: AbgT family transporter [Prevotellaceae bacterium]|nr:AbgT family transporter [Prevotellaceae bacterium]